MPNNEYDVLVKAKIDEASIRDLENLRTALASSLNTLLKDNMA